MQLTCKLTLVALSGLAFITQAQAGSRAWVSNTGTDSGTCLVTAPCRTFQYAHDQTSAGGEIDVKDSGGFGQLTITKAITIIASDGVLATIGVSNAGGNGVLINAGPNDIVTLRGLTVNGFGLSGNTFGFLVFSGNTTLDHVNVFGAGDGIYINSFSKVSITNSLLSGNSTGVYVQSSGDVYLANNIFTSNSSAVSGYSTASHVMSYGNNDAGGGSVTVSTIKVTPF